jgi:hypothetical protein
MTELIVVSRYANRVIEWRDINALNAILAQLQHERERIDIDTSDARLFAIAERVKDNADRVLDV